VIIIKLIIQTKIKNIHTLTHTETTHPDCFFFFIIFFEWLSLLESHGSKVGGGKKNSEEATPFTAPFFSPPKNVARPAWPALHLSLPGWGVCVLCEVKWELRRRGGREGGWGTRDS